MRNHWTDERTLDEDADASSAGRNSESSVAAQYEDFVPPDPREHDEPS